VDYGVETVSQDGSAFRISGLNSIRVGTLIEQSCSIFEITESGFSEALQDELAQGLVSVFSANDAVQLTGGPSRLDDQPSYFFAAAGLFPGLDIITLFYISEEGLGVEHTHISTVAP